MEGVPVARKKRITKQQRNDRLRRLMWPWLWWLGIHQRYRVDWCWNDRLEGGPWTKCEAEELPILATAFGRYPYRQLHICLATQPFDDMDDDELEHALIHELLHADVFWPLRRILNGITEDSKGNVPQALQADRTEYGTLEESAVDLIAHWLMRLKPEKGLPLLLKGHVRDKRV